MTQEAPNHPAREHRWITTFSGERIDSTSLRVSQINRKDCTRGLAMQTRYLGQIRDFYSIAEHSILVSRLSEEAGDSLYTQQCAFLHDGHEYITGDFPSPFKYDVPGLRAWEALIERQFRISCGLPPNSDPIWDKVKHYDLVALHFEARCLMVQDPGWIDNVLADEVPTWARLGCHHWKVASSLFRSRALQLDMRGF